MKEDKENKEKQTNILTYHVVSGKVMAKNVMKMDSAKTLNGELVKISAKDGRVYVNNAQVIQPDVKASNGVIHLVDTVFLPQ